MKNERIKILTGRGYPELALRIANKITGHEVEIVKSHCGDFANEELELRRDTNVRRSDLFIIDSLYGSISNLTAAKWLASTCRGAAGRITGVFPFLGYCKADHQKRYGEVVSIKEIANELSVCGFDQLLLFDLHQKFIVNYFSHFFGLRSVEQVYLMRLLIEYAIENIKFDTIIGLDDGSYKRNAEIARYITTKEKRTEVNMAFVYKYRDPATRKILLDESKVIGDVDGKVVIGFDDMIQGGGTVVTSAIISKRAGAKKVYILIVHPDFSPKTIKKINPYLEDGTIDGLIVVDTIPIKNREEWHKNLIVVDPSEFLAKTVTHVHEGRPMRDLFLPF